MFTKPRTLILPLITALTGSVGCDVETSSEDQVEADDVERGYDLIDTVEVDGVTIEFGRIEGGGIAIVEDAPLGEVSAVDALMDGERATPLELYLAVAPPERAIPDALSEDHVRYASEHGIDPVPRALQYGADDLAFRGSKTKDYLADCDLPDDGAYFDNYWQSKGWNWHWYLRTSQDYLTAPTAYSTKALHTHVCNDGPNGKKRMFVKVSGPGTCSPGVWSYVVNQDVREERRVQYRVWNHASSCNYELRVEKKIGSSLSPTYSIGIAKP